MFFKLRVLKISILCFYWQNKGRFEKPWGTERKKPAPGKKVLSRVHQIKKNNIVLQVKDGWAFNKQRRIFQSLARIFNWVSKGRLFTVW